MDWTGPSLVHELPAQLFPRAMAGGVSQYTVDSNYVPSGSRERHRNYQNKDGRYGAARQERKDDQIRMA